MVNELAVTLKPETAEYHGELLATSALGLTMAYVFGLIFALGIFPAGAEGLHFNLWLTDTCTLAE